MVRLLLLLLWLTLLFASTPLFNISFRHACLVKPEGPLTSTNLQPHCSNWHLNLMAPSATYYLGMFAVVICLLFSHAIARLFTVLSNIDDKPPRK